MDWYPIIKLVHLVGSAVLLGSGAMIAFFMLIAHRSKDVAFIAKTLGVVVLADAIFTTTAAVLQPLSGLALSYLGGLWPFPAWIVASVVLYVLIGCLWLPVVCIQIRMRDLALRADVIGEALPARYFVLFRIWFICGVFAFPMVIAVFWLMIAKPD